MRYRIAFEGRTLKSVTADSSSDAWEVFLSATASVPTIEKLAKSHGLSVDQLLQADILEMESGKTRAAVPTLSLLEVALRAEARNYAEDEAGGSPDRWLALRDAAIDYVAELARREAKASAPKKASRVRS